MNERIDELFGQALDAAVPYTWNNLDHVEIEKVMKEFAELIVRECSAKAWFAEQYDMGDGVPISKQIIEHFGVRE